jgi:hypothetical protein
VSATKDRVVQESAGGSGKWKQRNVPHRGWRYVGVEDLDEPSVTCEMCEAVTIRYVHYMKHDDHDGTLAVGCVCAEHMSGDYAGPRRRERQLANAARRRRTWLTRTWRESKSGNPFLNTQGYNVAIYTRQGRWTFRVVKKNPFAGQIDGEESKTWFCPRVYRTEDEAKLGAFDMLELIRAGELS